MRLTLKALTFLSLAAVAVFACSSAPTESSTATDTAAATRSCNPSHHHALCPPEGDPRWCDCILQTSCVDTGCFDPASPVCDPSSLSCVACLTDTDCPHGHSGPTGSSGSSSGSPFYPDQHCELTAKKCVECNADSQCHGIFRDQGPNVVCNVGHTCACASDSNCAGSFFGPRCMDAAGGHGLCGCASDDDCSPGGWCSDGACQ